MVKKVLGTVLAVLIATACASYPFGLSPKLYNLDTFGFKICDGLESYSQIHNAAPRNVEDWIINIKRYYEAEEPFLLRNNELYQYLKRNKNKLLITSDSTISVYYKSIDERNLLIRMLPPDPCRFIKDAEVCFFDDDGYFVRNDSLSTQVRKRVAVIFHQYLAEQKRVTGEFPLTD